MIAERKRVISAVCGIYRTHTAANQGDSLLAFGRTPQTETNSFDIAFMVALNGAVMNIHNQLRDIMTLAQQTLERTGWLDRFRLHFGLQ